ncbi:MAG: TonB-dependent receptor [Gammaproteobacteria bacterium]|jgi:iron complex outermembrane recepter protein|nr:TonB-dependent receptor [Gammaproteobacteria bacterium]MBU2180822.1 TonB-dependent receptor [Gammaproteobacteria bacterium]MBU2225666.1 TonB-dependent receptor [Gammaproteobacteria bacterium]MBU2277609.1 TonB-dependent receptor [Gammaproteobacteria bacterium]MBU2426148.1 TonB-dependent receptor [Gammaproteobacteria bacterium]
MKGKHRKLSYISTLVMLHLAVLTQSNAIAQQQAADDEDQQTEVIEIRGIRGSLLRAMDIKRGSDNIVDAISSEDIGKFPDQNVAESLQRISGVSIDREGGEGQLVTVRGMGPEFNAVMLNGRMLATVGDPSSMSWDGTPGGRAFSFDILPTELINGAEVHKTQSAAVQEGAIGATINITTMRPFDKKGFQAVASAKAMYDDMTGKTKPQLSGVLSNTFNDDKMGVLVSFARYERESRYEEANTAYYFKSTAPLDGKDFGSVYFPRNYDQIVQNEDRSRDSGTLVFQYQPHNDVTVTADFMHSKYDVVGRQDIYPSWFTPENVRNPELDANNTLIYADFVNVFVESMARQSDASSTLNAYGLNIDWQVNDRWKSTLDVSGSKAKSDPGKGWSDVVVGRPGAFSYDRRQGQQVPTMAFDALKPGDAVTAGWTSLQGTELDDEIFGSKLDNRYALELGPLVEVKFGVHYADRTLGKVYGETEGPLSWIYADNSSRIPLPDSLFHLFDAKGFLSGASGTPVNQWPTFNTDELMAYLSRDEVIAMLDDPEAAKAVFSRNGFGRVLDQSAYEVNEELLSFYTDFHFEGELSGMFWKLVTGVRYVDTTSTSKGKQIALLDLQPSQNEPGKVFAVYSDDYLPVEISNSYQDWLPSLNANLNFTDDVIGRMAWSKSITRPELNEMSPLTSYGDGQIDGLSGSGSNPLLAPYTSKNLDLSLEWYYEEGSYVALAHFSKDIDGYLGTSTLPEILSLPSGSYNYEISRPINESSTKVDGYEFSVQHMFTSLPAPFDGVGVIFNLTKVDSTSSEDNLPLIGLGDSQNLVLFYEKDAFQIRLAYNNRARFLQTKPVTSGSRQRDGHYVDDFQQLDISGSYDINDNFTVFFEGINLTNELTVKSAELANQTLQVIETGPRYALGVRAKF